MLASRLFLAVALWFAVVLGAPRKEPDPHDAREVKRVKLRLVEIQYKLCRKKALPYSQDEMPVFKLERPWLDKCHADLQAALRELGAERDYHRILLEARPMPPERGERASDRQADESNAWFTREEPGRVTEEKPGDLFRSSAATELKLRIGDAWSTYFGAGAGRRDMDGGARGLLPSPANRRGMLRWARPR